MQEREIPINPNDLEDIKCEKCGCIYFAPRLAFKKVSRLLTGAAEDGVHPYEAMVCSECGEPVPFQLGPSPQQAGPTIVGG